MISVHFAIIRMHRSDVENAAKVTSMEKLVKSLKKVVDSQDKVLDIYRDESD